MSYAECQEAVFTAADGIFADNDKNEDSNAENVNVDGDAEKTVILNAKRIRKRRILQKIDVVAKLDRGLNRSGRSRECMKAFTEFLEASKLYDGIKLFGSRDVQHIRNRCLPTKDVADVTRMVNRLRHSQKIVEVGRGAMKRRRRHKPKLDNIPPLTAKRFLESPIERWIAICEAQAEDKRAKWAQLTSTSLCSIPNPLLSGLPTLLRLIAETEYSDVALDDVNDMPARVYASCYRAMADWMEGHVPPVLDAECKKLLQAAMSYAINAVTGLSDDEFASDDSFPRRLPYLHMHNYVPAKMYDRREMSECDTNDSLPDYVQSDATNLLSMPLANPFCLPPDSFAFQKRR